MKFIPLLFLFFFAVNTLSAREKKPSLYVPDSTLRIDTAICFKTIRVADLRQGQHSHVLGTTVKLDLGDSLAGYIQRRGMDMIKAAGKGDNELLIVLHSFEPGYVEGNVSVFVERAELFVGKNNAYHFYRRYDEFLEQPTAHDVAVQQFAALDGIIYQYLYDAGTGYQETAGDTIYSEQEATAYLRQSRNRYPVYNTGHYNRGIYYSAEEFLNNTPSDTSFVLANDYLGNMEKVLSVFPLKENGKKGSKINPRKFFAVCDNGQFYCACDGRLVKLKNINGEFYTYKMLNGVAANQYSSGYFVFAGGGLFGAMFSVFASAAVTAIANEIETEAQGPGKKIKKEVEFYQVRFAPEKKKFVAIARYSPPHDMSAVTIESIQRKWPLPKQ